MSLNHSKFKRIPATVGIATICLVTGFILATGFQTPGTLTASQPMIQPASNPVIPPGTAVPLLDERGHSPFVKVAEAVKPTVVNITAEKELTDHPPVPFDMFDWGPFFGQPPQSGQPRRMPHVTSGGSGVIIGREGLILTNNHVISDADDITVKFSDKSELPAKVIGSDPETDVALLKVEKDFPPEMIATIGNSDDILIGDWAIAVGNPFGLDWTITVGVISARGRSNLRIGGDGGPSYQDFIQTDASINFGNSGGPLVNIRGEVVGVNTAINAQGQGIGFAIPINLANKIVQQLVSSGEVKRGYLGVVPAELDEVKREALGIDGKVKGVFVDSVQEGTPADKGGLKGGDVITEMDGQTIETVSDFRFRVADHPPDSELKMTIWREGKKKDMEFKLADRKDYLTLANAPKMKSEQSWLGIQVAPTDSRYGQRLGVEETDGVLVISIAPETPAEGLIEQGDIIVEVGGMEVASMEDYNAAIEKLKDRTKAIPFWVLRDGRRTFVPVRPN